jgi:hypothetical protein
MTAGKLILVTKLKGGSGATTTCRELAAAALHDGCKVALIDLDGQGGLSRWWNRRTAPAADGDAQRVAPDLLQLTAAQIPAAATARLWRYRLRGRPCGKSGNRRTLCTGGRAPWHDVAT